MHWKLYNEEDWHFPHLALGTLAPMMLIIGHRPTFHGIPSWETLWEKVSHTGA